MQVGPQNQPHLFGHGSIQPKVAAPKQAPAVQPAPETPAEAVIAKIGRAKEIAFLISQNLPASNPAKKSPADLERFLASDRPGTTPKTVKELMVLIEDEAATTIDQLHTKLQQVRAKNPFSEAPAKADLEQLQSLSKREKSIQDPARFPEKAQILRLFNEKVTSCLHHLYDKKRAENLTQCMAVLNHFKAAPNTPQAHNLQHLETQQGNLPTHLKNLQKWLQNGANDPMPVIPPHELAQHTKNGLQRPVEKAVAPKKAPPLPPRPAAKASTKAPLPAPKPSMAAAPAKMAAERPRSVRNCEVVLSVPSGNCLYESIATSFNRTRNPDTKAETAAGLRSWAHLFCQEALQLQSPHYEKMCNRIHISITDYNDTLKAQFDLA